MCETVTCNNPLANRDPACAKVSCAAAPSPPPPPAAPPHTPAEGWRGSALCSLKLHTLLYKCCIPGYAISPRGFYRSTPMLHLRLSFFFSFLQPPPPVALWQGVGGGGGVLHAPGLQIQPTRTKHYIILSSSGGGGGTSRACTNQNLLSPLFNYASPAPLLPGGAGGADTFRPFEFERARLEGATRRHAPV